MKMNSGSREPINFYERVRFLWLVLKKKGPRYKCRSLTTRIKQKNLDKTMTKAQ